MKLKNITRYPIHIRVAHQVRKSDLIDVVLPPSGIVARRIRSSETRGHIDGIPVHTNRLGEVLDLPEAQDGVLFVAAPEVAQIAAFMKRDDIVAPDCLPPGGSIDGVVGISEAVGLQTWTESRSARIRVFERQEGVSIVEDVKKCLKDMYISHEMYKEGEETLLVSLVNQGGITPEIATRNTLNEAYRRLHVAKFETDEDEWFGSLAL